MKQQVTSQKKEIQQQNKQLLEALEKQLKIEQELKLELDLARQQICKLESISILAGGIAHNFNNILTALLGNITLAQNDGELPLHTQELLKKSINACSRATGITQQLLSFTKGGTSVKKIVQLPKLMFEADDFVLAGTNTKCIFRIDKDLHSIEADEAQILQVFNNLFINARQAMPKGGQIECTAKNVTKALSKSGKRKQRSYVEITVKDEGHGIESHDLNKIFDPYFTTKPTGSGLGLATCASIIKEHKGKITVSSKPNCGSQFTITLPASEKIAAPQTETMQYNSSDSKKILIMDDEDSIRSIMSRALHFQGYRVTETASGEAAVETYREAFQRGIPYDLVIIDLTVPAGIGGQETLERLKEINPNVKAIVASGYQSHPVIANFQDYGFCAALPKPFNIPQLSQTINRVFAEMTNSHLPKQQ